MFEFYCFSVVGQISCLSKSSSKRTSMKCVVMDRLGFMNAVHISLKLAISLFYPLNGKILKYVCQHKGKRVSYHLR